ncbi:MAG: DUF4157 domain-containing protein [Thermoanaerobaculia bacterium]
MAQRSAGPKRGREPASGPGARRERSPEPAGEVPKILELGTALGNRATAALLGGGLLQRKVAIGPADDPLEREADRLTDRVLSQPAGAMGESVSSAGAAVQRQCAACAAGGKPCPKCEQEEDEELQRKETAGDPQPAQVASHLSALGAGQPLSPGLRGYFEPRFGHDFGGVRLHTGSTADAAARAARARAFTLRSDVVFASGEYTPSTPGGRRLLAHELAHVVQQAPPAVRRQPAETETPPPQTPPPQTATPEAAAPQAAQEPAVQEPVSQEQSAAAPEGKSAEAAPEARGGGAPKGLIVADDAKPGPGQTTKSAFLDELHTAACAAAEEGLEGTEHSAKGCPWLDHYFRLYERMSADRIEADLLRYVPATRGATTARDYIAPAAEHIRESVTRWAATGELTGVPKGLPGMGLLGAIGGSLASLGRMLFKARSGGARDPGQPAAVAARLGEGRPLTAGVRSRMEGALGTGLGSVRLHTDATASRLAGRFNAHAFAVGPHVAFGAGEYQPGTLAGDALLAHELAHVVQQRGSTDGAAMASPSPASGPLEHDADRSAAGVVAGLWAGAGRLSRAMAPRLRSGLSLQRCHKKKEVKSPTAGACPSTDAKEIAKLKAGLQSTFKLSAVVEEGKACWTKGELEKVGKGLAQLSDPQRAAIVGITLKRVKTTTCDGSPPGCFQRRINNDTGERRDSIELADEAFKGAAAQLPPVEDVVLHEVGHAVEAAPFRAAESARLKSNIAAIAKNKARGAAVDAFNAAAPSSTTGKLQISWDIGEEKKYGEALLAANKQFTDISEILKGIGDDPSSKVLSDTTQKIEKLAGAAAKDVASIDKSRAAVLKKRPGSTKLQPGVEKSLQDRLKATRALIDASKAQIAAQEKLESDKAAEKAASAKIPLADQNKVIDGTRRLAELVALVELKGIDVKASKSLRDYPKKNWPQKPGELFADLFQMSVSEPAKLKAFDPDIAEFFTEPIGPKGKLKKQVDAKIGAMAKSAQAIEKKAAKP